jgi:hypothetical protein
LSFWSRIGLAFSVFFRALFDGAYAARLRAFVDHPPDPVSDVVRAPGTAIPSVAGAATVVASPAPQVARAEERADGSALLLLSMLQTEGRFVDFVQQDIAGFPDTDVGAVARVVHAGCRKVLAAHLHIEAIRAEPEGQSVNLEPGFDPNRVKLTGNVAGAGRLRGVLRHRGWQATEVHLPTLVDPNGALVLCPAEVEM